MESKALQKDTWQDQLDLVRSMCPKSMDDTEFEMYLYTCRRYGFDPIMKELVPQKYFNKREQKYSPVTFITTHAAYLSIAHRTKMYGGMESSYNKADDTATAIVHRRDSEHPTKVTIEAKEYDTHKNLWKSKRVTMAKKVAEAHALRRAFNINGIYLAEEIEKEIALAESPAEVIPEKAPAGAFRPKPKPEQLEAAADKKPEETKTVNTPKEKTKPEDTITDNQLDLIKQVRRLAGNIGEEVRTKVQEDLGLSGKLSSQMTVEELAALKKKFTELQPAKDKPEEAEHEPVPPADPEPPKEPEKPAEPEIGNNIGTCTKCGEINIELKGDICWGCSEEHEAPEHPDNMVM